ncbi:tetratricopeptide repeat protein [Rossellomorea sp. NS-SX7]|uniref:tetratricopeptide repeat protein n=1 Tax=Rossellomorea sp. NS-SX7 TaxID=3463856 RepID=UPI004059E1DE
MENTSSISKVTQELVKEIEKHSYGSYLIEGNPGLSRIVSTNFCSQVKKDHFIYEISCKSLLTDSYSFVKKLISPYITSLEKENPSLLVKYKQSLCLLMPYLREKKLFEDVILGLDVPREENPTSFTMSFIVSMLNGIINFLLEISSHYAEHKPVVFILKDIDQCDYSSLQLIKRLIIRSSVCSYYVILTSSKHGLFKEKEVKFNRKFLINTASYSLVKDMETQLQELDHHERSDFLKCYIESCGVNDGNGLYSAVYHEAAENIKFKYHQKQITSLHDHELDMSSKYAKLLFHMEAINDEKVAELLEDAAYYCRISGYYNEAVHYVSHSQSHYWSSYDNQQKAKLLRIKGVGHIRLKENADALDSLEESLRLAKDPYFKARLCYTIGSFVIKHEAEMFGPKWLDRGFDQIQGLENEKATLERLWLNNSKALIKYRERNYEEAIKIEEENLNKFKETFNGQEHAVTHAILHYNTAYVLQDSGRLKEALNHIDEGIGLVPSNLDLYNNKANILQQMGKFQEAIPYYNRVKNDGYPKVEVYINLGNAYMKSGEFDKALENYNYAVKLAPDNPHTWNARGHLGYVKGTFQEAISDFSNALDIDPTFISALINRANTFAELGKNTEAIADYGSAENSAPNRVEIFVNRGAIFQEAGEWKKAKQDLEHALNLAPSQNLAYIYANLAVIYSQENKLQQAKEYIEQAVAQNPSDPWIKYNKAHLHIQLKEWDSAYSEIKKALEISPTTKDFIELKDKIPKRPSMV